MNEQGSQGSHGSQGSQGSQGYDDPQQPDLNTSDHDEPGPYKPKTRADVAARPGKRPRKYTDGKKLRLKNAQGVPQYNVSIVGARYDDARQSWMYILNDWRNERIAGEKEEMQLV